mmetsp:Transcript_100715/g.288667  ORF Transcript_100715/g.288667 Transcript_100715/m.288667 type:complete len:277 (+) Transcript_100715:403-1233(+)
MPNLLVAAAHLAVADVLPDRVAEKLGILRDHREEAAQRLRAQRVNVLPVHVDGPAGGRVEAQQQLYNRALAAAGAAHDPEPRARRDLEGHVVQDHALAVAEHHVLELDLGRARRCHLYCARTVADGVIARQKFPHHLVVRDPRANPADRVGKFLKFGEVDGDDVDGDSHLLEEVAVHRDGDQDRHEEVRQAHEDEQRDLLIELPHLVLVSLCVKPRKALMDLRNRVPDVAEVVRPLVGVHVADELTEQLHAALQLVLAALGLPQRCHVGHARVGHE